MTSTPTADKEVLSAWQFVALADYSPPAAPVVHTVKRGLNSFLRLVQREEAESAEPFKAVEDLRVLSEAQLARVAPALDPPAAVDALLGELKNWLEQEEPNPPVLALMGPPYSGHRAILQAWASQQGWSILEPPTAEQILAGDEAWLEDLEHAGRPWVFPALERAYLRHASGLSLVRRFLDQAYAGEMGRGIIGCDSWAWAFLRHTWHGRFPVILAVQALDQERLASSFQRLAHAAGRVSLRFRQSDNGYCVLEPPDVDPEDEQATDQNSNFLQLLAAHARGIGGVAWEGWRAALRTQPDEVLDEEAAAEDRASPYQTVWVIPWGQLQWPALPGGAGRDEAFVLHALLLHDGLPLPLLWQLVPLSSSLATETLYRLQDARLVEQRDGLWRVSALGYPAARQFLHDNGYLVDAC